MQQRCRGAVVTQSGRAAIAQYVTVPRQPLI
jgi:hypothetical protein